MRFRFPEAVAEIVPSAWTVFEIRPPLEWAIRTDPALTSLLFPLVFAVYDPFVTVLRTWRPRRSEHCPEIGQQSRQSEKAMPVIFIVFSRELACFSR